MLARWIAQAGARPLDGDVYGVEPTRCTCEACAISRATLPAADEPFTVDEL